MRVAFIGLATWAPHGLNLITAAHAYVHDIRREAPRRISRRASGGQRASGGARVELICTSLPARRTSTPSRSDRTAC